MPIYLADVNLKAASGLAEDDVHNGFVLNGPQILPGQTLLITQELVDFYNNAADVDVLDKLSTYIGPSRSRALLGIEVRYYDITARLGGQPHGSPVATDASTLGAAGGANPLPEEVALVLTLRGSGWQGQPVERPDGADEGGEVDRPRQRVSGRLYIGPFDMGSVQNAAGGIARPTNLLQGILLDSAERLYDGLASINYVWSVWSRANANVVPITDVQVDNAFDTQRRRGPAATIRSTRTVSP